MRLQFGFIKEYFPKGFGFVSKELASSRYSENVYFHIKTIKHKYFELAQKIDSDGWRKVSFWYVTDQTHKGEAVSEVWLTVAELPQDLKSQLLSLLESCWSSLAETLPSWLEKTTLDVVGEAKLAEWKDIRNRQILEQKQAEQKRREEERRKAEEARLGRLELERIAEEQRKKREAERLAKLRAEQESVATRGRADKQIDYQNIKAFCNQCGIATVVHFTRVENLPSILTYGLLSRKTLDSMDIEYVFNDGQRIDRYYDAICTSISFPNYKMFYRYRINDPQNWAVLLLDVSLLWELDCAFCQENAASNAVTRVPLQERKKFSALQLMFADLPNINLWC